MFALETSGLGRRYGGKWALSDCFLAIPEGSVVGLVGPNGAGKTTLLKIAAGLTRSTEGSVRAFGIAVDADDPATRSRVRFLAQEHPLYPGFTVSETLELGRRLNRRWDDGYATARVAAIGIDPRNRVRQLSHGQKAQVALTLVLSARPDLLLLDEPLASLDPLARRNVLQQLMETVSDQGTTVVLSSHVLTDVERVADRLALLNKGRVQVSGSVEDLLRSHSVLVGPAGTSPSLARPAEVVSACRTPRQATLLVRDISFAPTGWDRAPATLEEVVLGYMENDRAVSTPRPSEALTA